jgi:DNA-binding SARP family transcriptional activator
VANVNTSQKQQLRFADKSAGLRIRLLGPISVTNDGRPVPIAAKKARALLGYLALREGTEVSRSVVTDLLWGERSESQARASLRQTLSELRGVLGSSDLDAIIATKETITWVPGSAWIDAKVLETATDSDDEDALRQAATLATGELMEGLAIGEAGFEQWLANQREHFRLIASRIYARLMELAEHRGALEEALTSGLQLLSVDPLQDNLFLNGIEPGAGCAVKRKVNRLCRASLARTA